MAASADAASAALEDRRLVPNSLAAEAGEDGGGWRVARPARHHWLLPEEGHLKRRLFGGMQGWSAGLPVPRGCPRLGMRKPDAGVPGTHGV